MNIKYLLFGVILSVTIICTARVAASTCTNCMLDGHWIGYDHYPNEELEEAYEQVMKLDYIPANMRKMIEDGYKDYDNIKSLLNWIQYGFAHGRYYPYSAEELKKVIEPIEKTLYKCVNDFYWVLAVLLDSDTKNAFLLGGSIGIKTDIRSALNRVNGLATKAHDTYHEWVKKNF